MRIHISSPSTDCWFCQDQMDRNLHSVLLSAWRPWEETSALGVSGTCAPSPGRRWHGTVKETGAQCGDREEAAKESLSGTRMGLLAPFSPLCGQSLGSPSSHSDHVLGWPKISFPIPSYGKTRTNILAYPTFILPVCLVPAVCWAARGHRGGGGDCQTRFQVPKCSHYNGGGTGR